MKRTSGWIVVAFAMLFLHGSRSEGAVQVPSATAIQAAHIKTSVVPAEDSGDDDGDDGADAGGTE